MRIVRIALLVAGAVVAPFVGFVLGAMAAAVLARSLTGDPATVDTAIPLVGIGGAAAAVIGWTRLLHLAHHRHLRRLRRSGPALEGRVVAARTSFAKNPRGPGHWTVRLKVAWTEPSNGRTHETSKAFGSPSGTARAPATSSVATVPSRRSACWCCPVGGAGSCSTSRSCPPGGIAGSTLSSPVTPKSS